MKKNGPFHALTMVIILYLFCYVLINRAAKAEPEQLIILQDEELIVIQIDPEDPNANVYIFQEDEQPIVCAPTGDAAAMCL